MRDHDMEKINSNIFFNIIFSSHLFLLQRGTGNENWTDRGENSGIYHIIQ